MGLQSRSRPSSPIVIKSDGSGTEVVLFAADSSISIPRTGFMVEPFFWRRNQGLLISPGPESDFVWAKNTRVRDTPMPSHPRLGGGRQQWRLQFQWQRPARLTLVEHPSGVGAVATLGLRQQSPVRTHEAVQTSFEIQDAGPVADSPVTDSLP